MKYFLAILTCVGVCIAYLLIGAGVFGWEHGGGVIPMLILFAALGAIWRKMTKRITNNNANNLDGVETPFIVQNQMTVEEKQKITVEQTNVAKGTSEERAVQEQILGRDRQAIWIGVGLLVVALMAIPIVYFPNPPTTTQADNIPDGWQPGDFSIPSSRLDRHPQENAVGSHDSRFALIRLPMGISIEVPKNWLVLEGDINTTIETAGEAAYRLTGMELPARQKVNLFRANSNPPTTYASIAINATTSDISPAELLEADEAEIRELAPLMHQMLDQGLATQNCHIIRFDNIVREIINGHPALVISYVRSGPNDPVAVQMTRLFMDGKEISLNLSYRLSEIKLWKPVVDYMRTTFRVAWPEADKRYSE